MAASPFQFGGAPAAPPASPFGFSSAQTASAAPTSSAPAFGAAASAPGAFSFGQAAPGAASTPAFGTFGQAAPKPAGTFGAPATGTSLFGGTSAPSLFGATSAPAFGAAASAPSLFGAASTTAFGAASSAPSLFGGTTASPFGAAPAAGTATIGLFGAPAQTATTGLFGQPAQPAQQAQQANVFGAGAGQLPGLVDPSGLTQDDAVRALGKLAAAYTPTSPDYRFQTLFVSVVERPEQRVKPAGVDENKWRAALAAVGGPANPDKLWPVVASGFRDLNTRSRMQVEAIAENANRLRALQDRAAAMSRRSGGEFRSRAAALQRTHAELGHRLLRVVRCVDALESRLALSAGYNAHQSRQAAAEVSRQLGRLEEAVAPRTAGAGLQSRLEAVAAAARMRAGGAEGAAGGSSGVRLDERSAAALFGVLRDHAEAVRQLQTVLKADELDVEVMKRLAQQGGAGGGGEMQALMA